MLNYHNIIEWIENNFSVDDIEELEYADWEMESDIAFYRKHYSVPAKFNWIGKRISFKNISFFFKNNDLIGYYKDKQFIERCCIFDWTLCELYNIPYINPHEIVEDKWGVLKHKPTNTYLGIETPIGHFLEPSIYKANIIGSNEWVKFKKMGCQYFSESIEEPYYIDNDDLEFIEIEIVMK